LNKIRCLCRRIREFIEKIIRQIKDRGFGAPETKIPFVLLPWRRSWTNDLKLPVDHFSCSI
jgi:hypothetical protein